MEEFQKKDTKRKYSIKSYLIAFFAMLILIFSLYALEFLQDETLCSEILKTTHKVIYWSVLVIGAILFKIYYYKSKSFNEFKYYAAFMIYAVIACLVNSLFIFNYFFLEDDEYKEKACIIEQTIKGRGSGTLYSELLFKDGSVAVIGDNYFLDRVYVGGVISVTLQKGLFGYPVVVDYDTIAVSDNSEIYSMKIDDSKSYYDNALLCDEAESYAVAHKYYKLSYEKGKNGYALWRIGRLYEEGLGVEKNLLTAYDMYMDAIYNGCKQARKDAKRVKLELRSMGYK